MDTPYQKRLARLMPVVKRLCVPKCFRHNIIRFLHGNCGYYSVQNLFHTLATRYYRKTLFADSSEFCKTSAMCKRTKVNFSHRHTPLHPVLVPDELGLCFAMDHKILTRKTEAGNTAVLVIVECFSGYPHLICVKDTTAEITAKAIVHNVIQMCGLFFQLYSDK